MIWALGLPAVIWTPDLNLQRGFRCAGRYPTLATVYMLYDQERKAEDLQQGQNSRLVKTSRFQAWTKAGGGGSFCGHAGLSEPRSMLDHKIR